MELFSELARRLDTRRKRVARILDPDNESITLKSLAKAAALVGGNAYM